MSFPGLWVCLLSSKRLRSSTAPLNPRLLLAVHVSTLDIQEQTSSSLGHLLQLFLMLTVPSPLPFATSTDVLIGIFEGRALLLVCDRQLPCKLQSDKVFTRMKADSKA